MKYSVSWLWLFHGLFAFGNTQAVHLQWCILSYVNIPQTFFFNWEPMIEVLRMSLWDPSGMTNCLPGSMALPPSHPIPRGKVAIWHVTLKGGGSYSGNQVTRWSMLVELRQISECSGRERRRETHLSQFSMRRTGKKIPRSYGSTEINGQVGSAELPECGPEGHMAVPAWWRSVLWSG